MKLDQLYYEAGMGGQPGCGPALKKLGNSWENLREIPMGKFSGYMGILSWNNILKNGLFSIVMFDVRSFFFFEECLKRKGTNDLDRKFKGWNS